MSKRMAKLYEKAWNKVVENLVPWKKDIIVNHKDESPQWEKVSNEVTKAAVRMAESWEWDIENKKVSK